LSRRTSRPGPQNSGSGATGSFTTVLSMKELSGGSSADESSDAAIINCQLERSIFTTHPFLTVLTSSQTHLTEKQKQTPPESQI